MEIPNVTVLSNFIKMQILLSRGNTVLRDIFLDRWSKYYGSDWDPSLAVIFISGIGKKVYGKLQTIQRKSVESGDLNEWDLTTLADVLMLTDFPNDPRTKKAKSFERSKLEELKKVRNKLAHAPSIIIADESFENFWQIASEVLLFFGCPQDDLDKIKSSLNLSAFQDENSSGHVNKANSEEATRLKNEANEFYKIGEFKKAIEIYSEAILMSGLLDSQKATLYSNRSVAYLTSVGNRHSHSEEIHCALQDGKEAIRLNPTWYRGYYRTANAYFKLGKFKEALEYFDGALSLSPGRAELRESRDNCRMKLGQETRREHMDPAAVPISEDDALKLMQTRFGNQSLTLADLARNEELNNKRIPGFAYVGKANEFMNGIKGTYDPEMAAKLYSKAAALGNAEGMYNLGLLHEEGKGVKQDFKMGIKLMRQAASQPHELHGGSFKNIGVAEAEHSLGLSYEEGVGVTQDHSIAAEWYTKASDHGHSGSSNNLGFLHMSGRGVPFSTERGIQYWKLAANQGNQLAMQSLAMHYLEKVKDPREAREWFERAVKHGNLTAQLNRDEFEDKLEKLEKEDEEAEHKIAEWESNSDLSGNGMTLKCRLKRMMQASGITDITDGLESTHLDGIEKGSSNSECDPTVLQKYASNGSVTAKQILTSISHFDKVCELLSVFHISKTRALILHELAECYRIEGPVLQFPRQCKEQLHELVTEALKHSTENTMTDLDKDARICFAHLRMDNSDHILIFSEHSKKKYPDEREFHRLHSNMCRLLRRYELGAEVTQKSLKMFPKDVSLLYSLAVHLQHHQTVQRDVVIKAYEEFLTVAAIDHLKVPECYYAISNTYFAKYEMIAKGKSGGKNSSLDGNEMKESISKMEEFYQLGLKAEEIQLPCFLPYQSKQKTLVENRRNFIRPISSGSSAITNQSVNTSTVKTPIVTEVKSTGQSQIESQLNYTKLSDPHRVLVIKSHREQLKKSREVGRMMLLNATTPTNIQRVTTKLVGLEPITFLEMDTLVDKVYEGRVIQVTSIEDAGFNYVNANATIQLVLEDESRNVHRAFIYNFPERDEKIVQEKLGFGAKMSVLNPYMRLARDGHFGIRVDDAASLLLHTPVTTSCRFCINERAHLHCLICKWAYYCSKKCQEMDSKLMEHKLICMPL